MAQKVFQLKKLTYICTVFPQRNYKRQQNLLHQQYYIDCIKQKNKMKKGIHPENYRPVIFKDMSNGDMFLSRSTAKSNETEVFEGQEYPLIKIEISSTSHPFYTGKAKLVDTAGRVDKFMNRWAVMKKK